MIVVAICRTDQSDSLKTHFASGNTRIKCGSCCQSAVRKIVCVFLFVCLFVLSCFLYKGLKGAQRERMDVLTQMLTDPLDPKEENVDQITEECMLGNCRVNLPEDLLEDVS